MKDLGFKITCLDCGETATIIELPNGAYKTLTGDRIDVDYLSIVCKKCDQTLDLNAKYEE